MTGVAVLLKSMGLDLSPAGLTKLLEDTGIGPKIVEAQGIVSGFISHIDARFDAIEKRFEETLDIQRGTMRCIESSNKVVDANEHLSQSSHTETHRQLEEINVTSNYVNERIGDLSQNVHVKLELMNTYLEALTVKLSQMHEDILDKGAAGPHTVGDAILIDPLEGFELAPIEREETTDVGTDPKPN